jgi:basic amino acid/polyamine antiporter, APA family
VARNPSAARVSSSGPEPQALQRRLGPLDAAAIIVSNVIGGGILFTPPQVAAAVPNPYLFLATWVAGGLLAFAGAMAYAELAALRPRAGGEYVYLREAYGGLAGFLTGWTSFIAGFAGAIAANAMIVPFYLERFAPGANSSTPWVQIPIPYLPLTLSTPGAIAIAIVWLLAVIHIRGVGPGRVLSNALTILKLAAFLAFIAIGLVVSGAPAAPSSSTAAGAVTATGWLLGLIVVMFVYSGWNAAAYMAEEVRNPGRNLPLALALGTGAVTLIYILINVLYLKVIPIQEFVTIK